MSIDDPEFAPGSGAGYDADWDESMAARDEFFLSVANRRPRSRILDLGCGTGRLTIALAQAGHEVMGVDPNPEFLHHATTKPGADLVAWVRGTAARAPTRRSTRCS